MINNKNKLRMLPIYMFFYILIRIYVFAKVFFLMCMTYYYPESYPIDTLTWWMYFLIFDIWLEQMLPSNKIGNPNKQNKD
jgi:hypothetical protein